MSSGNFFESIENRLI